MKNLYLCLLCVVMLFGMTFTGISTTIFAEEVAVVEQQFPVPQLITLDFENLPPLIERIHSQISSEAGELLTTNINDAEERRQFFLELWFVEIGKDRQRTIESYNEEFTDVKIEAVICDNSQFLAKYRELYEKFSMELDRLQEEKKAMEWILGQQAQIYLEDTRRLDIFDLDIRKEIDLIGIAIWDLNQARSDYKEFTLVELGAKDTRLIALSPEARKAILKEMRNIILYVNVKWLKAEPINDANYTAYFTYLCGFVILGIIVLAVVSERRKRKQSLTVETTKQIITT